MLLAVPSLFCPVLRLSSLILCYCLLLGVPHNCETCYIARQLLEDTDHYLRCQPNLNQLGFQTISAFTSDKDNLEKMEQAALAYLANGGEAKLDELIQRLA